MGTLTRLVNCPGIGNVPISKCGTCRGCLGMETDENGMLYVFCSEEDPNREKKKMEEHIIKLEKRIGNSTIARSSYIVPKRVYDAINVLLNPTIEGLSVREQENSDNTS